MSINHSPNLKIKFLVLNEQCTQEAPRIIKELINSDYGWIINYIENLIQSIEKYIYDKQTSEIHQYYSRYDVNYRIFHKILSINQEKQQAVEALKDIIKPENINYQLNKLYKCYTYSNLIYFKEDWFWDTISGNELVFSKGLINYLQKKSNTFNLISDLESVYDKLLSREFILPSDTLTELGDSFDEDFYYGYRANFTLEVAKNILTDITNDAEFSQNCLDEIEKKYFKDMLEKIASGKHYARIRYSF